MCAQHGPLPKGSKYIREDESSLQASWRSLLVCCKVAARDCMTEACSPCRQGSGAAKSGTDEPVWQPARQELHMRFVKYSFVLTKPNV